MKVNFYKLKNKDYIKYIKYILKYNELLLIGGGKIDIKTSKNAYNLVNMLYNYIKTVSLCFSSGTFIVELTENKISNIINELYKNGIKRRIQKTHTNFKDTNSHLKNKYKCYVDKKCQRNYTIISEPQKEIVIDPYNVSCDDTKKIERQCVLMYPFTLTVNNVATKYMFIKIETDCTIDFVSMVKHGVGAIKRYILKNEKDSSLTRREDHIIDIKKKHKDIKKIDTAYKSDVSETINIDKDLLNKYKDKQDFYTKYLRTGRELFLSSEVLDSIQLPLLSNNNEDSESEV